MVNPDLELVLSDIEAADRQIPESDLGRAEEFIQTKGSDMRFVVERGQWMVDNGKGIWKLTDGGDLPAQSKATACAKDWAECYRKQAERLDPKEGKELRRKAVAVESRASIQNIVFLSRAIPGVAVESRTLDSNHNLIGTRSGVLNLLTGTIEYGSVGEYVTMEAPVEYDPDATCPTFEKFLKEMLQGDEELQILMFQWLGYLLSGDVSEQKFMILHGDRGRNGKSVLFSVLETVLGPYVFPIEKGLLTVTRGDKNRFAMAEMEGRRVALASETSRQNQLDTEFIKSFTAGDAMFAERKGTQGYKFTPQAKLIYALNRLPRTDFDSSFRSRVIPVPLRQSFYGQFEPEYRPGDLEPDKQLAQKLKAEAPGIFRLMVEGYQDWRENGLFIPKSVQAHIDEFESQNDTVADWMSENCSTGRDHKERLTELYQNYRDFCTQAHLAGILRRQEFKSRLEMETGFQVVKPNNLVTVNGISINRGVEKAREVYRVSF